MYNTPMPPCCATPHPGGCLLAARNNNHIFGHQPPKKAVCMCLFACRGQLPIHMAHMYKGTVPVCRNTPPLAPSTSGFKLAAVAVLASNNPSSTSAEAENTTHGQLWCSKDPHSSQICNTQPVFFSAQCLEHAHIATAVWPQHRSRVRKATHLGMQPCTPALVPTAATTGRPGFLARKE